jgi:hypothetical protein
VYCDDEIVGEDKGADAAAELSQDVGPLKGGVRGGGGGRAPGVVGSPEFGRGGKARTGGAMIGIVGGRGRVPFSGRAGFCKNPQRDTLFIMIKESAT